MSRVHGSIRSATAILVMMGMVAPVAVATTWDVAVPSVHVTGSFLLNGQPFPGSFLATVALTAVQWWVDHEVSLRTSSTGASGEVSL
jgi:hypothetical protein